MAFEIGVNVFNETPKPQKSGKKKGILLLPRAHDLRVVGVRILAAMRVLYYYYYHTSTMKMIPQLQYSSLIRYMVLSKNMYMFVHTADRPSGGMSEGIILRTGSGICYIACKIHAIPAIAWN
eukprot:scaffold1690_cov182-Amphora_coffeaeformis.AAC.81